MPNTQPKCVLVVDDDDGIRVLVGEILKLKGYRVEMASDGLQALAKIASTHPDAIVLDLMMPVMDGWTFLERCRADPLCGSRPVVVMSAYLSLRDTAAALNVQGVVGKPFDLDALLYTLEPLLEVPSD